MIKDVQKNIHYAFQNIDQSDIDSVIEVLKSKNLTQGPKIEEFEKAVANKVNVTHAVAVNSASSALHLACLALDVGPGDWVWTSPNTFVASANCAIHCGANIDFVDIDPRTYNMSIDCLSEKLKTSQLLNRLPKVVIPVHFAGQPCDMSEIYKLSQQYGFQIIEDASHAIGAKYNNIKVGSCYHSQITIFSFHPVKIITSGEGGMLLTKDNKIYEKLLRLRTHGITSKKEFMQFHDINEDEIWNYQQIELGFNYRLTDIQAALGISQLKRLDNFLNDRHDIAKYYDETLKNLPVVLPYQAHGNYSSYHLYPILIKKIVENKTQKEVFNIFRQSGIFLNLHYTPVHLHPFYKAKGFKKNNFPVAEQYHREVLTLPIYSGLTRDQLYFIVNVMKKIFME